MRDLASIDFQFIVRELADAVIGARIDKLYAPEPERLVLQLRKGGVGRSIVVIHVPKAAYLSSAKEEMPEKPSSWCVRLRNLLEGMKITAISQPSSERCIRLSLAKQDASYDLYAEFFAKGNLVVVDKQGIATAVLFEREFKDRAIAANKPYTPPAGPDILGKDLDAFTALVTQPFKGAIASMLATKAALGKLYSQEVCARAGIDPNAEQLAASDAEKIYDALHSLIEAPITPMLVGDAPFPLRLASQKDAGNGAVASSPAASFSAAIEKAIDIAPVVIDNSAAAAIEDQATRLRKSIAQQVAVLDTLEAEAQRSQQAGERIYERYQDVDALLKGVAEARKKGTIAAFLKAHPEIKEYKQATGDIIVIL